MAAQPDQQQKSDSSSSNPNNNNNNHNNNNDSKNNNNSNSSTSKSNTDTNHTESNNLKPPNSTNINNDNHSNSANNFNFDYSQWNDNPDFNFLADPSIQMDMSGHNTPFNINHSNVISPIINPVVTPASPADYAIHLQLYQNMLLDQSLSTTRNSTSSATNNNNNTASTPNNSGDTPTNTSASSNKGRSNLQNTGKKQQQSNSPSDQQQRQMHMGPSPLSQQLQNQFTLPYNGSSGIVPNFIPPFVNPQQMIHSPNFKPNTQQQMTQFQMQQQQQPQHQLQPQLMDPQHDMSSMQPPQQTTPMSPFPSQLTPSYQQSNLANTNKRNKNDPPQPRTKVRPCDHCRRRKTKCVMLLDSTTCKMCQTKGLKCTFKDSNNSLKRNMTPSNDDNVKRMKFEDPSIIPPPDVQVRDTLPIKDYATMQGHSLLKKTLSLQYPRSSFYVGPTSIYDSVFLDRISLDKIDQFQLNKTNSIRKVSSNVQFTLRDDYTEDLYERSEWDADSVERYIAPHGQSLIDLYFRTVHPSFPILHKKVVLEKYSRTHREFGAPLLAAVYCLAIQWWDYDPHLSQFPKPNVVSLHKFALKTFSDVIQRPKLSAVQAGLLLMQCRTGGTQDNNWLLCSQVVALAEELGLGLDCAHWRLPKWERGLRRRLAWAVYVQDKWSSLIESRPSHILEGRNWLVRKVSSEDFPEKSGDLDDLKEGSADFENGEALFREMISLSEILSEILDTFFTMASMENVKAIDQLLKLAKPLQLKLRDWYHSLPKTLQMNSIKPRKFNSNGYLQLAYFAVEITLHRRIISCLNSQKDSCPPELVKVCRNAAKTRLAASIEFTRDLKAEHIQSFWQSSAVNNFALIGIFATILYVTSDTVQEANSYKQQLYDYRWILKVNSKSFDIASDALEKIDGVLRNIPGLLGDHSNNGWNNLNGNNKQIANSNTAAMLNGVANTLVNEASNESSVDSQNGNNSPVTNQQRTNNHSFTLSPNNQRFDTSTITPGTNSSTTPGGAMTSPDVNPNTPATSQNQGQQQQQTTGQGQSKSSAVTPKSVLSSPKARLKKNIASSTIVGSTTGNSSNKKNTNNLSTNNNSNNNTNTNPNLNSNNNSNFKSNVNKNNPNSNDG